ncbi:MAG: DUF262 domain-containing protein [Bacillota bacterium]
MNPEWQNQENQNEEDVDFEIIESEVEDSFSGPPEYQITVYPADFTLEVLHKKFINEDIVIPKFQRQFVWKQMQSSKLIESFLVGLPVPAIYLYTERQSNQYLVVDGQQRLKSICFFFEGFFGEETKGRRQVFRLKGLHERSKWRNKSYKDFDEADQRKFRDCVLRSFIIQQLDPQDDTSIYHVFERLNTGGTSLTNQEVRNCVYGGNLKELLTRLNKLPAWRSILGKTVMDSRQKDIELILRFFALNNVSEYEKPLKDWLSRYMRIHRNARRPFLENLKKSFSETCTNILSTLGEKPFHVRTGLNSAVFDSVMVAFSKNVDKIPRDVLFRYKELLTDDTYQKLISRATTDVENVVERFRLAEHYLFQE